MGATDALRISMDYTPSWAKEGERGDKTPLFINWTISNVKLHHAGTAMHVTRSEGSTLSNISLIDLEFVDVDNVLFANEDDVALTNEDGISVLDMKDVESEGLMQFKKLQVHDK